MGNAAGIINRDSLKDYIANSSNNLTADMVSSIQDVIDIKDEDMFQGIVQDMMNDPVVQSMLISNNNSSTIASNTNTSTSNNNNELSSLPSDVRSELDQLKVIMEIQQDNATLYAIKSQQNDTDTMSFIEKKFPALMVYLMHNFDLKPASKGTDTTIVQISTAPDKMSYDICGITIEVHKDYVILLHNIYHEDNDLMLGTIDSDSCRKNLSNKTILETLALLFALQMHGKVTWTSDVLKSLSHRLNLDDIGAVYHYLNPQGIAMLIKTLSETIVSIPNFKLPEFPRIQIGGLLLPCFLDAYQVRKPPSSMLNGPKPYSNYISSDKFQDVTLNNIMNYFTIGEMEGRIQLFYDLCASLVGDLIQERNINYAIKNFDSICDKLLYRGKTLNDIIRCRINTEKDFPSNGKISRLDYNGLGYKVLTETISVSCHNGINIIVNIEYQCMKECNKQLSTGDHFLYEMQRLGFNNNNLISNNINYIIVNKDINIEEFNQKRIEAVEAELFGNELDFDTDLI